MESHVCFPQSFFRLPNKVYVEGFVCEGLIEGQENRGFSNGWEDEKNRKNFIPMIQAFKEFLLHDKLNILLLTGSAGSGKSTALDKLRAYILNEYSREIKIKRNVQVILLHVSLPSLKDPLGGVFEEGIRNAFGVKLNSIQIQEVLEGIKSGIYEIVFILDSYDELRNDYLFKNIWRTNSLEMFRNSKVIITCRSELFAGKDKVQTIHSNASNKSIHKVEYLRYFLPIDTRDSNRYSIPKALF